MVFLFFFDGRMEPIVCLLFCLVIKIEVIAQNIFLKNIPNIADSTKNIQKTSKCCNKNIQKESYFVCYSTDFQMNTHSFLPPPTPFLKGGMKFPKHWVEGAIFKRSLGKTEREGERKCKCGREDGIFSISFSHYYLSR